MTIYKEYAFDVVKNCKIDIDKLDSNVYDLDNPQDMPLNYKGWFKTVDIYENILMAATYLDTTHTDEYYRFNIDVMGDFLNPECCVSNPPHELLCEPDEGLNAYCVEVHTAYYDGNPPSNSIPDHIFDEAMLMLPCCEISLIGLAFDIAKIGANFVLIDIFGKETCTAVSGAYGGYYMYENKDNPDLSGYDPLVLTGAGVAVFGGAQYLLGIVAEHVNPIIKEKIGLK